METIPTPRIYLSAPVDVNLEPNQRAIKDAIINTLEAEGFEIQEHSVRGQLATTMPWGFDNANQLMSRCQGAVVLALARWHFIAPRPIEMPTEFSHFDGALAIAQQVPLFIIAEQGVMNRGIVYTGGGHLITFVDVSKGAGGLQDPQVQNQFRAWIREVKSRPRVFLGYCGKAKSTATELTAFMEHTLGVTVRNYAMDFQPGSTILEEIEKAARDCTCGVFLFTKDDPLEGADPNTAAPRDNVVFEAGFFTQAKGKERTLIIREEGAKMPADLGGNIYIPLKDRNDISTIHTALTHFLAERL